jgi:hypothetical protein
MAKKADKVPRVYEDLAVWETATTDVDKKGGQGLIRLRRFRWTETEGEKRTGIKFMLQVIYRKKDKKEIRKDWFRLPDQPEILLGVSELLKSGADVAHTVPAASTPPKAGKAKKANK